VAFEALLAGFRVTFGHLRTSPPCNQVVTACNPLRPIGGDIRPSPTVEVKIEQRGLSVGHQVVGYQPSCTVARYAVVGAVAPIADVDQASLMKLLGVVFKRSRLQFA
jgi:hypothetical protein